MAGKRAGSLCECRSEPGVDGRLDSTSSLDRDFARWTIIEMLLWLFTGAVVWAILLYIASRGRGQPPAWLSALAVVIVFAMALVSAVLVRLRGLRARRFVRALGPQVRECGLVHGNLVVVFKNHLVLSVGKGALLPADGQWVAFERFYNMDHKARTVDLVQYERWRRRTVGLGALEIPPDLRGEPRRAAPALAALRQALRDTFEGRSRDSYLSFREREVGSRDAHEVTVREAEAEYLLPEWHREGSLVGPQVDRLAPLIDAAMDLVWEQPLVLASGSLRAKARAPGAPPSNRSP